MLSNTSAVGGSVRCFRPRCAAIFLFATLLSLVLLLFSTPSAIFPQSFPLITSAPRERVERQENHLPSSSSGADNNAPSSVSANVTVATTTQPLGRYGGTTATAPTTTAHVTEAPATLSERDEGRATEASTEESKDKLGDGPISKRPSAEQHQQKCDRECAAALLGDLHRQGFLYSDFAGEAENSAAIQFWWGCESGSDDDDDENNANSKPVESNSRNAISDFELLRGIARDLLCHAPPQSVGPPSPQQHRSPTTASTAESTAAERRSTQILPPPSASSSAVANDYLSETEMSRIVSENDFHRHFEMSSGFGKEKEKIKEDEGKRSNGGGSHRYWRWLTPMNMHVTSAETETGEGGAGLPSSSSSATSANAERFAALQRLFVVRSAAEALRSTSVVYAESLFPADALTSVLDAVGAVAESRHRQKDGKRKTFKGSTGDEGGDNNRVAEQQRSRLLHVAAALTAASPHDYRSIIMADPSICGIDDDEHDEEGILQSSNVGDGGDEPSGTDKAGVVGENQRDAGAVASRPLRAVVSRVGRANARGAQQRDLEYLRLFRRWAAGEAEARRRALQKLHAPKREEKTSGDEETKKGAKLPGQDVGGDSSVAKTETAAQRLRRGIAHFERIALIAGTEHDRLAAALLESYEADRYLHVLRVENRLAHESNTRLLGGGVKAKKAGGNREEDAATDDVPADGKNEGKGNNNNKSLSVSPFVHVRRSCEWASFVAIADPFLNLNLFAAPSEGGSGGGSKGGGHHRRGKVGDRDVLKDVIRQKEASQRSATPLVFRRDAARVIANAASIEVTSDGVVPVAFSPSAFLPIAASNASSSNRSSLRVRSPAPPVLSHVLWVGDTYPPPPMVGDRGGTDSSISPTWPRLLPQQQPFWNGGLNGRLRTPQWGIFVANPELTHYLVAHAPLPSSSSQKEEKGLPSLSPQQAAEAGRFEYLSEHRQRRAVPFHLKSAVAVQSGGRGIPSIVAPLWLPTQAMALQDVVTVPWMGGPHLSHSPPSPYSSIPWGFSMRILSSFQGAAVDPKMIGRRQKVSHVHARHQHASHPTRVLPFLRSHIAAVGGIAAAARPPPGVFRTLLTSDGRRYPPPIAMPTAMCSAGGEGIERDSAVGIGNSSAALPPPSSSIPNFPHVVSSESEPDERDAGRARTLLRTESDGDTKQMAPKALPSRVGGAPFEAPLSAFSVALTADEAARLIRKGKTGVVTRDADTRREKDTPPLSSPFASSSSSFTGRVTIPPFVSPPQCALRRRASVLYVGTSHARFLLTMHCAAIASAASYNGGGGSVGSDERAPPRSSPLVDCSLISKMQHQIVSLSSPLSPLAADERETHAASSARGTEAAGGGVRRYRPETVPLAYASTILDVDQNNGSHMASFVKKLTEWEHPPPSAVAAEEDAVRAKAGEGADEFSIVEANTSTTIDEKQLSLRRRRLLHESYGLTAADIAYASRFFTHIIFSPSAWEVAFADLSPLDTARDVADAVLTLRALFPKAKVVVYNMHYHHGEGRFGRDPHYRNTVAVPSVSPFPASSPFSSSLISKKGERVRVGEGDATPYVCAGNRRVLKGREKEEDGERTNGRNNEEKKRKLLDMRTLGPDTGYHCRRPSRIATFRDGIACGTSAPFLRTFIEEGQFEAPRWLRAAMLLATNQSSPTTNSETSATSTADVPLPLHNDNANIRFAPSAGATEIVDFWAPSRATTARAFADHSGHHYTDAALEAMLMRLLRDYVCPPSRVRMEITENDDITSANRGKEEGHTMAQRRGVKMMRKWLVDVPTASLRWRIAPSRSTPPVTSMASPRVSSSVAPSPSKSPHAYVAVQRRPLRGIGALLAEEDRLMAAGTSPSSSSPPVFISGRAGQKILQKMTQKFSADAVGGGGLDNNTPPVTLAPYGIQLVYSERHPKRKSGERDPSAISGDDQKGGDAASSESVESEEEEDQPFFPIVRRASPAVEAALCRHLYYFSTNETATKAHAITEWLRGGGREKNENHDDIGVDDDDDGGGGEGGAHAGLSAVAALAARPFAREERCSAMHGDYANRQSLTLSAEIPTSAGGSDGGEEATSGVAETSTSSNGAKDSQNAVVVDTAVDAMCAAISECAKKQKKNGTSTTNSNNTDKDQSGAGAAAAASHESLATAVAKAESNAERDRSHLHIPIGSMLVEIFNYYKLGPPHNYDAGRRHFT